MQLGGGTICTSSQPAFSPVPAASRLLIAGATIAAIVRWGWWWRDNACAGVPNNAAHGTGHTNKFLEGDAIPKEHNTTGHDKHSLEVAHHVVGQWGGCTNE